MPYKHIEKKISEKDDKRVKLTAQDKIDIRETYINNEHISQRDLAKKYNVSRRSIVFAIYPERRVANYENRVANGGSSQYYDRDKHTKAMRIHRHHKQDLELQGKLI